MAILSGRNFRTRHLVLGSDSAEARSGGRYGLGWFVEWWHGLTLYSHPRGVQGTERGASFLPEQRLGWVVLTNVDDQRPPKGIRESIFEHLLN